MMRMERPGRPKRSRGIDNYIQVSTLVRRGRAPLTSKKSLPSPSLPSSSEIGSVVPSKRRDQGLWRPSGRKSCAVKGLSPSKVIYAAARSNTALSAPIPTFCQRHVTCSPDIIGHRRLPCRWARSVDLLTCHDSPVYDVMPCWQRDAFFGARSSTFVIIPMPTWSTRDEC